MTLVSIFLNIIPGVTACNGLFGFLWLVWPLIRVSLYPLLWESMGYIQLSACLLGPWSLEKPSSGMLGGCLLKSTSDFSQSDKLTCVTKQKQCHNHTWSLWTQTVPEKNIIEHLVYFEQILEMCRYSSYWKRWCLLYLLSIRSLREKNMGETALSPHFHTAALRW